MATNLTNSILTQIAVKRLSGKAMTSGRQEIPTEKYGSAVQNSAITLFGETVPNDPSTTDYLIQSSSQGEPGTVQYVTFDLVTIAGTNYANSVGGDGQNSSSAATVFDQDLGDITSTDTFHAYHLRLPNDYVTQTNTANGADGFDVYASTPKILGTDAPFQNSYSSTGSVQFQVVPEYLSTVIGTANAYIPDVIATDGTTTISKTAGIDYYFDAFAGILFVQDPAAVAGDTPNASVPEKIKAFLYVGKYQNEVNDAAADTDWYVNDGTYLSYNDYVTSSRFVKVADQGLFINSGTISNLWGFDSSWKNSVVGSHTEGNSSYEVNTSDFSTDYANYTGSSVARRLRTYATAEAHVIPDTTIYPVCLTGKEGEAPAPTGLNEGYPYNYLVFNPGFKYEIDPTDPPPPPPPPGDDDPHPTDDTGLGGSLIVDGGFVVKSSPITRSSPSSSLPPLTGSNEAPPAVVIRPQGGIFFFETGSTLSSSGSYLAASASARILYNTSSKALSLNVGTKDPSDLTEIMFISKSGINPRVGIGTTSPKRTLDISSTSDDIFGGELVLEGQRTSVGGEINDEGGRITYAIRSGSFKSLVSGSIGTIVGVVDDITKEGVQGSLSFRVAQNKTSEPQQVLKLVGAPGGGPTIEFTGSAEFSSDVTIRGNLIIDGIVDSDISSSGGISASKDIQTGQDVIAQNFVIKPTGGGLQTVGGAEYISLNSNQITIGFGGTWSAEFNEDSGFAFNTITTGPFAPGTLRDFRVGGNEDNYLFFVSGGDSTVGIGTSTPDEKLTVDGNIKATGNIIAVGDIIAQNYIVSSSVTYMTQSFSSGSTIFGDTLDDTHQFTGSVDITGSLIVDGMTYPTTDGTVNQVLTTDGSGNLSFQTLLEFTGSVGVSGSIEGVDYIDFSTSASVAYNEGRLFYDKENGSLGFYNEVADITLQVGQEFYKRARNESGATITNGTPVRISGSQGDYPLIYPAFSQNIYSGSYDAQENKIIGIATHNIEHLTEGYVTEFGIVRNVDTTAFAAGDQLYLQTGSGGFRNTPPPFPFDVIPVGEVIRSQANGFIEVRTSEPITSENISGIINIETEVISDESTTIQKGTPVHVVSEGDGPIPRVKIAKASDANLMPATFVVTEAIPSASQGTAMSTGYIFDVDTSAFTVGDVIFVDPNGGYTNQKPTGSNLIQNLGVVLKVSATEGSGFIYGAGRANDVPNISPGYAWVGNSNSVATAVATSSFVVTTANTASYVTGSNVDGAVGAAIIATTAATSDQIDINNTSNDQNYGLVFRSGNTDGYQQIFADNQAAQPSYNPSTNTITTPIISASSALYVSGNITVEEGDITTNTISNVTTVIGSDSATNVDTFNTSSYTGAIYDYVLIDTTVGARAGQFMIAQDNGSVTFTDNSTRHLFDTTEPEISGQINGSNVEVQVTNGNGYTFKSFVKKL